MKKQLLSIILALLPMLAMADESGSCGTNVTYTFVSSTGTLTIQGSGTMTNYDSSSDVPWYSYRTSIKTVIIEEGVTSIGSGAFEGCSGLTSITIPNSVMSIGNRAFSDCSGLTSITIPNSVVSIGYDAFKDSPWWNNYSADPANQYGNIIYINDIAYKAVNTSITSCEFKEGTISTGSGAFEGCSGLTSVTIPNSVTSIGSGAFKGCSGLTSITIPNSVTSIGGGVFEGCSGLTSVTFHCKEIGTWFSGNKSIKKVTIGNEVTSIGDYAFLCCSSLTSVIIGNSVTSIGDSSFSGCSSITFVEFHCPIVSGFRGKTSIKVVIIGNEVTSIGDGAFAQCSGLTSVTIPNSVTSIGYGAFYDSPWWYNYSADPANQYGNIIYINDVAYKAVNTFITSCEFKEGTIGIGGGAFYDCSSLTSVTIPNSVTSIGNYVFSQCSGLTSVTIGNSVTSIGYRAFSHCSGLSSITIPNSVTSIGSEAFYYCSGLTSVTIPNSVTSIGDDAFYGSPWWDNYSADPANQYGNIIYINDIAFKAVNTSITSCEFKEGTISIGVEAFMFCSGLTSVTIPNSVTSIGGSAFYGCSGLQSIYSKIENVFNIYEYTFGDATYNNAKLYVPIGKKATYQSTDGWKNFANIEEYDYPSGIVVPQQSKDAKIVDVYQLNGQRSNNVSRGINIIRMSDGTTRKVVVK